MKCIPVFNPLKIGPKSFSFYDKLRGDVTKKIGKIWGKFPKGGGLKKTDENSQFQFGVLKNRGGGLNFSKMSEFQLFCNYFAILPL